MQATIEKSKTPGQPDTLVIRVPLSTPRRSKSGDTMLVASDTAKNAFQHEGHEVTVNLNAYYK